MDLGNRLNNCDQRYSKNNKTTISKKELVELAKKLKLKKYSTLSKGDLCKYILESKEYASKPKKAEPKVAKVAKKAEPKVAKVTKPKPPVPSKLLPKVPPKVPKLPKLPTPPPKVSIISVKTPIATQLQCVAGSKMELLKHQVSLAEHLLKNRGAIAAFPTGSGKTAAAIASAQCILAKNSMWKVIVVTPVSLQGNFKKEMDKYGVPKEDRKRYSFYTLTNFSNKISEKKLCNNKTLLIIDEAHNLRTKNGERVKNILKCTRSAGRVLLLTATPIYNNPEDIINLVAFVKGEKPIKSGQFKKIIESDILLKEYIKCIFLFHKLDEHRKGFPQLKEEDVVIEMSDEYYNKYRKLETEYISNQDARDPFKLLNGVRQATLKIEVVSPKIQWTFEKIKEDVKAKKRIVVFSSFKEVGLKNLEKLLKGKKIKYVKVTGDMKAPLRDEAVREYNNGDVYVLLISKAGGEGLDLKETRDIILLEPGWNEPAEEQVIGRGVRLNSHKNLPVEERLVTVYHLYLKKSDSQMAMEEQKQSADILVKEIHDKKIKTNNLFLQRLYDSQSC